MQIYLVGGAVRDQLLGLPVTERDWVVVGATAEDMLAQGFQPVGKDFPVFLHPDSKEEYALARTERKTAKGYKGFQFYADPCVTLEEDLKRRDLTINAMAQTEDGQLIDPYGGQTDLANRCFRHVSPAFAEDPVRILRLARFAARFIDFTTHPDTIKLIQTMVAAGEVDALVAERVWKECEKALNSADPTRFFDQLQQAHALASLFPCADQLTINQQALGRACALTSNPCVRWAAWNATQSKEQYQARAARYRIPSTYKELTELAIRYAPTYLNLAIQPDADALLTVLVKVGALRDSAKLHTFQQLCQALSETAITEWNNEVNAINNGLLSISTQALQDAGLQGKDFADALKGKRLQLINARLAR